MGSLRPFNPEPSVFTLLDIIDALDDAGFNDTRKVMWLRDDASDPLGKIWLGYADEVLGEIPVSCKEWYEAKWPGRWKG